MYEDKKNVKILGSTYMDKFEYCKARKFLTFRESLVLVQFLLFALRGPYVEPLKYLVHYCVITVTFFTWLNASLFMARKCLQHS